jgi:hypothetical protein
MGLDGCPRTPSVRSMICKHTEKNWRREVKESTVVWCCVSGNGRKRPPKWMGRRAGRGEVGTREEVRRDDPCSGRPQGPGSRVDAEGRRACRPLQGRPQFPSVQCRGYTSALALAPAPAPTPTPGLGPTTIISRSCFVLFPLLFFGGSICLVCAYINRTKMTKTITFEWQSSFLLN